VEKLFRRRPQKVLLDIRKYRFRSSSYFTLSLHDALPILTDGVHQRFVGHHEKYRGIFRRVLVTMKIPERHDEGVALFPFVTLIRSEEHTSELQSLTNLVCRLLLEKKKKIH